MTPNRPRQPSAQQPPRIRPDFRADSWHNGCARLRPCLDAPRLTDLRQAGFALPEILIVLALMAVVMGIGIGSFSNEMATVQGDADMNIVYWQLKLAREIAINQRRSVEVVFTQPNFISLVRHDVPNGTTLVSTAVLEHRTSFMLFQGMGDTPDGFGNQTAIDVRQRRSR